MNGEYVGERPIQARRPDVGVGSRIDQLRTDFHATGCALHRPFDNVCHTQVRRDLSQITTYLQEKHLCGETVGVYGASYGAASAILFAGRDPRVKQHLTLLELAMAHNNIYGLRVEWWHFTTADWKKCVPYWEDPGMSQTGESPSPKS